ncbi:MAG TPA: LamG domain-containing protein, partial [Patescibacteria group bacterium]|nr:LamG domain-containing protein [Patescibacteria group bacterium]
GTNYVIFTPARGGTQMLGFEETTVNPFGTQVDPQALTLNGPGPLPIGTEVYVAITYDPVGGSSRLYINGALVASASGVFNPTRRFTDYSNWLGRSQWQRDPFFNGIYDEFRVWEGILSDKDVASHYAAGPDQQFATIRPALNISSAGSNIFISWPGAGTSGFQLQTASALQPGTWLSATNEIMVTNGNYQVTLPTGASPAFFRLKY